MKHGVLTVLFFSLIAPAVQSAVVGGLTPGASYLVVLDGVETETRVAAGGQVNVSLPSGMHLIAIQPVTPNPEPTPSASPVPGTEPTADPTPTGVELFLAGFDETSGTNRYEVLDPTGRTLTGPVTVLEGVRSEGEIQAVDLDGDDTLEVVAAGYHPTEGVVFEIWNGQGENLGRVSGVFPATFSEENYLKVGDFDGFDGKEVVLMGRDENGDYRIRAYDAEGSLVADIADTGIDARRLDSVFLADVNGDGAQELVVMGRKDRDITRLYIFNSSGPEAGAMVFGQGYEGAARSFPMDVDGDGTQEIVAIRRNVRSRCFRMLVLAGDGAILMKKNLLTGKFEKQADFSAADLDGDGRDEITAVGRIKDTGDNVIQVVDDDGRQFLARAVLGAGVSGSVGHIAAEVNGDGELEIIVGGRDESTGRAAYQILDSAGDTIAAGTSVETADETSPAWVTVDFEADGTSELLLLSESPTGDFGLEVRDAVTGEVRFGTTFSILPLSVQAGNLI